MYKYQQVNKNFRNHGYKTKSDHPVKEIAKT